MRGQNEICPGCGTRAAEWEDDDEAYVAITDRCRGCAELGAEADELHHRLKGNVSSSHGYRPRLVPRRFATEKFETLGTSAREDLGEPDVKTFG